VSTRIAQARNVASQSGGRAGKMETSSFARGSKVKIFDADLHFTCNE